MNIRNLVVTILFSVCIHLIDSFVVFSTTNTLFSNSEHGRGMKLKSPPQIMMKESTTCFRFYHEYILSYQTLLWFKWLGVSVGWAEHGVYGRVPWKTDVDLVTNVLLAKNMWTKDEIYSVNEMLDWDMKEWNSACLNLDTNQRTVKFYLNSVQLVLGEINESIANENNLIELETNFFSDLRLMGGSYPELRELIPGLGSGDDDYYGLSMFGKITDINIWNKSLKPDEVINWSQCKGNLYGNIIDWVPTYWEVKGFREDNINKVDLCSNHDDNHKIFLSDPILNSNERGEFCQQIGGKRLIIDSSSSVQKVMNEITKLDESWEFFYTGLKRVDQQTFIHPISSEILTWNQLSENLAPIVETPIHENDNIGGKQNCVLIAKSGLGKMSLADATCNYKSYAVCELQRSPQFQLRGFCKDKGQRTFYYVQHDSHSGVKELLGYGDLKISLIPTDGFFSWNLMNIITNKPMAYLNVTRPYYPIGRGQL